MQASKWTSEEEIDFTKDIVEVFEMEKSPEHCAEGSPSPATESAPSATEPPLPSTEPPLPSTEPPLPPLPPDFEKYWKSVQAYPEDFNTWTYLLQYVEQENHLFAARKAFDAFLAHYPYCYGYWKKYADLEKKNNNILEADEGHLPREFLTSEKFIELRKELASMTLHGGTNDDIPSGLEEIKDPAKRTTEVENMRHRIIEVHQEIFNLNEHEVSKIWNFEEEIKRPYFHVKPLEKAQLNNWKEYLEFELENGSNERIVILFERCVIACACYEEFWIKYAKYMENHSVEGVRHVYNRACHVHLAKKPMVHLLWAAFEEQQGNLEESRRILKNIETAIEGLAMVRLRRVNLERRHGNVKEAENLLEEAMNKTKTSSESSFYAIKLARHLFKVQANVVKARKVLSNAIQKDKENTKLYLNLLEIEYNCDIKQNEENILAAFDKAIKSPMSIAMRVKFSQRKVEFLEDFGSDVNKLLDTYNEHQKLLKHQDIVKRKAENGLEQPEAKRLHAEEVSTAASVPVTTASMDATQSGYNYGSWYQYNYPANWNFGQYYNTPST